MDRWLLDDSKLEDNFQKEGGKGERGGWDYILIDLFSFAVGRGKGLREETRRRVTYIGRSVSQSIGRGGM